MTFYDPEDPLGWQQIAQSQGQGNWNPNGLPPELLYALAGQMTPMDLQSIQAQGGMAAMQQAQPTDPGQAFIDSYGANYLEDAAAMGEMGGLYEQKPQYWWDDLQEMENILSKRGTAAASTQYDIGQDQFKNQLDMSKYGLAEGAAARDERGLAAELGNTDMDRMYLESLGLTGEGLMAELAENPQAAYDSIAALLPMNDQYGNPWNAHPTGVNRMMSIVQSFENDQAQAAMQAQPAMADPAAMQAERWGQLTPDLRAKEMFLNQQQPGVQRTVDPRGGVHYGPGAEQDIASGYTGSPGSRATLRFKDQAGGKPLTKADIMATKEKRETGKTPAKPKSEKRGLVEDWQKNRYNLRAISAYVNPVARGYETQKWARKTGPKVVKGALNYINPFD